MEKFREDLKDNTADQLRWLFKNKVRQNSIIKNVKQHFISGYKTSRGNWNTRNERTNHVNNKRDLQVRIKPLSLSHAYFGQD